MAQMWIKDLISWHLIQFLNFVVAHFAVMKPVVNQTVSFFFKRVFCHQSVVKTS